MVNDGELHDPSGMKSRIGVAIKKVGVEQNHVGLLYRDSSGVSFCHLAFHHDLRFEKARTDYHWSEAKVFEDDDENELVLAARMIALEQKRGMISYGFFSGNEPSFDADGQFVKFPAPGMGLTCATFVLELFHSMAFYIADVSTWQDRVEDAQWKAGIIASISKIDPNHGLAVKDFKDCARVRPEEAAACAISPDYPTKYDRAVVMAQEILADLNPPPPSDSEA